MLEFRILGPLEVVDEGRRLPLGRGHERALLAVLLLHANEVVSIDRLLDALWPERPPATAVKALQGYVSQLRKLLGDQRLETRPPGYVLHVDRGELDADQCSELIEQGRRLLAAGDPEAARAALDNALSLFRGQPLAEFQYEQFARGETETRGATGRRHRGTT